MGIRMDLSGLVAECTRSSLPKIPPLTSRATALAMTVLLLVFSRSSKRPRSLCARSKTTCVFGGMKPCDSRTPPRFDRRASSSLLESLPVLQLIHARLAGLPFHGKVAPNFTVGAAHDQLFVAVQAVVLSHQPRNAAWQSLLADGAAVVLTTDDKLSAAEAADHLVDAIGVDVEAKHRVDLVLVALAPEPLLPSIQTGGALVQAEAESLERVEFAPSQFTRA
eukprot:scaffold635_cov311-Pinguiococcus_pyrenoidosus.AAC.17